MKTESMTKLLKQKNVEISAVKANKILLALEILEDKERTRKGVGRQRLAT